MLFAVVYVSHDYIWRIPSVFEQNMVHSSASATWAQQRYKWTFCEVSCLMLMIHMYLGLLTIENNLESKVHTQKYLEKCNCWPLMATVLTQRLGDALLAMRFAH